MIKTKEFAYDDLIMSDSEFANIVSDAAAKLTPEEVIDMILRIIVKESDGEDAPTPEPDGSSTEDIHFTQ